MAPLVAPALRRVGLLALVGVVGACAQPSPERATGVLRPDAEILRTAELVRAGIHTSMIDGSGLNVRDFVGELQHHVPELGVRLYAHTGEEVYAPKGPPPEVPVPGFAQARATNKLVVDEQGVEFVPLQNEERCQRCHERGTLRGVLQLTHFEQPPDNWLKMGEVMKSTFVTLMTTDHAPLVTRYLGDLSLASPTIVGAAIFSTDQEPSLGDHFLKVPEDIVERALQPGSGFEVEREGQRFLAYPLASEARCQNCHKDNGPVRGALIVELTGSLTQYRAASRVVLEVSAQNVMLSGLGRILKSFFTDTLAVGAFSDLVVYDSEGRLFFDPRLVPNPPEHIADVLASHQPSWSHSSPGENRVYVLPLVNEVTCKRCHKGTQALRGAVEVTLPPWANQ